ncbi:unnamed protein product [Rotaria magnacalcarata]|nr:unnamed protein product [Rotaria magnacalcarata]CAF4293869.1 unnamed protein product [Rotaria magnacalcarata]
MASELANRVTNELKSGLPEVIHKSVLAVVNGVENPNSYTDLLLDTEQLIVFTESSDTYKKLDEEVKKFKKTPILNCANFNNAELQNDLFDVVLLIKSFNRLNTDEKQKLLKNVLKYLKVDGQIFVYENEWSKENESHSTNPADLIHYFNSTVVTEKQTYGF